MGLRTVPEKTVSLASPPIPLSSFFLLLLGTTAAAPMSGIPAYAASFYTTAPSLPMWLGLGSIIPMVFQSPVPSTATHVAATALRRSLIGKAVLDDSYSGTAPSTSVNALIAMVASYIRVPVLSASLSLTFYGQRDHRSTAPPSYGKAFKIFRPCGALGLKYHFETYSTSIMTTRLLCQIVNKGLNVQMTLRRVAKSFLSDRHQLSTLPTLLLSTPDQPSHA